VRPTCALVVVALGLALAGPADSAVTGEQRILLVSATWGPEHYAAGEAASALAEAARFVRSASFGQTWIVGEATPWLRALPGPPAQCDLPQIERLAREAAVRAGYDLTRYTRLGFSFPRVEACPWGGAYFGDSVWANGFMSWELIAHELGHLYGVPEEGPAWVCDGGRCEARNYESPYSVMGHGSSDYNAYEKAVYGWLTNVTRVERAGELALAAIDRPSSEPQAVHVLAGGDEYWLEYRPPLPLWPPFQPDAPSGVVVYGGDNGIDEAPSRFTQRNLHVADPAGVGRPSLRVGERFSVAGGFEVAVEATEAERAVLRFRWTDSTAPGAPRILRPGPTARGRRALVRWRPALDRGSGVAAHEIVLDGRRARRIPAVRSLGTLVVPTEPELLLGRLAPGAHRVEVRAVDRAGNRGPAAVRRFRVPR
jgi:hypothetical protein